LYNNPLGKAALHILFKRKLISSVVGMYMDSGLSRKRIQEFIDEHELDMTPYTRQKATDFRSFNDFFYRKIRPEARPIEKGVVSPSDGKVLVFQEIEDYKEFFVKGKPFTLKAYFKDQALTEKYKGGSMFIVRLAPTDYHRFHFPATGSASPSELINGFLYSVSPLALKGSLELFCENKRTLCTLATEEYGDILISDVGATMVGSIVQTYKDNTPVNAGEEKGYFAFGGSTLVLFFEKGKIQFSQDLLENTKNGMETAVKMGETIALKRP
jgi:phosphatidylserine decarboxylase